MLSDACTDVLRSGVDGFVCWELTCCGPSGGRGSWLMATWGCSASLQSATVACEFVSTGAGQTEASERSNNGIGHDG